MSSGDVGVEPGRFDRHRLLDWFDQDQVMAFRALVVGAGAIGNEVLKNLALLGVARITIVDFDEIEVHNLTRSVLFRDTDVGQPKASVAAARVKEIFPDVALTVLNKPLEEVLRPSGVAQYDMVFSCLDSFEARLALDELCLLAGVNVVNGAIDARYASVEVFPYASSRHCGCYSCNLPSGAYQRIAQRYSCGWLRRIGIVERKVPTTIVTSSLAASMMVSWGLRMGGTKSEEAPAAKRMLADSFTGESKTHLAPHNPQCPSCNEILETVEILPWSERLNMAANAVSAGLSARTPTELVFAASCAECGFDASETIRPGTRVRSYTTDARKCPACGSESVAIDARDTATLAELADLRGGATLEAPYVIVNIGQTTLCLEISNE